MRINRKELEIRKNKMGEKKGKEKKKGGKKKKEEVKRLQIREVLVIYFLATHWAPLR